MNTVSSQPATPRKAEFSVLRVLKSQRRTLIAPFHEPGGDWTFFDCLLRNEPQIEFTLGVGAAPPRGTLGHTTVVLRDVRGSLLGALGRRLGSLSNEPEQPPSLHVAVGATLFGRDGILDSGERGSQSSYVASMSFDDALDELSFRLDPIARSGTFSSADSVKLLAFLNTARLGVDGPGAVAR